MSVKDINKTVIISSSLTGKVIANIDKDYLDSCGEYIGAIVYKFIENDEGLIIKVGYKS